MKPKLDGPPITNAPQMSDVYLNLCAASLSAAYRADKHQHVLVVKSDELLGLDAEVVELCDDVGYESQKSLGSVVDGPIRNVREVVDLDLGVEEVRKGGEITRRERLVTAAGKLHVLLRHRPPSISRGTRRTQSRRAYAASGHTQPFACGNRVASRGVRGSFLPRTGSG